MRSLLVVLMLVSSTQAHAAWPSDVSVTALATSDGQPSTDEFRDLVRELGSGLSNYNNLPANTTGIDGFDAALGTSFWFIDAYDDTTPTAWQRSNPDGAPPSYQMSPSLVVRKGLPLSTEVGLGTSWFAGSGQGAVHAFARVGLLEGHLPWPSVTLHAGYTGYIGNDELELGVVDLAATLGTTLPLQRSADVTQSHFSPYLTVSMLRMRAQPVADAELLDAAGIVAIGGPDTNAESQLTAVRVQGGFQVDSGPALYRLNVGWTPGASLLLGTSVGIGF